jgi:hypothetical protein
MKLRALAVLLLLVNLGFFAWTQGWLDGVVSGRARGDREPERLAREFQPQRVRILPPNEAAAAMAASAPPPTATVSCLEAGPYTPAEVRAAETLLQQALPAGSWARRSVEQPGSWIVYLGRFTTTDAQQKKIEELRRLPAPFEEVKSPPELAPGLSLGRVDNRAAADRALEQLSQRGVRTARVVSLSEPATMTVLRVERADPTLSLQIAALGGDVKGQPLGKAFGPCAK